MKIKPLEWKEATSTLWEAETQFSHKYRIFEFRGDYTVTGGADSDLDDLGMETSLESAKDSAQYDFEQRVMACFETTDKSNFWG